MATQTMTLQPFSDCGCGCSAGKSSYDSTVPDPGVSGDLQTTSNGTCINSRSFTGGTYSFDYSADSTTCSDCMSVPLKSGGSLDMSWSRMSGQDSLASAYQDTWMPGGASSVFSFLPRATLNDLSGGVQRVYSKSSPLGTLAFDSLGGPRAELAIFGRFGPDPSYFTTYDQKAGVYFEYFGGSLTTSDSRYGRLNRRYDTKGNVLQYNYANNVAGKALLRSISGDVGGNVIPYFYYANETIDTTHFAPITQIVLTDLGTAANSRTVYFEYQNQVDAGGNTRPYLSKIVNPNSCVEQFAPVVPFPLGDPGDPYQINNDTDANGFSTSFTYSGGTIATVIEPESRITYCEYPSVGETRQIQQGRSKRFVKYALSSFGDQITRVGQHTDPLGNSTYYSYDTSLSRIVYQIDANGNFTYFEYVRGTYNQFALSRKVSTQNQASTYFGYGTDSYDPQKKVGPRWEAGTNIEVTYYRYDAFRNRTAMVDGLGNTTLYGPDSLGRNAKVRDARSNTTYYNYSATTGGLGSVFDPLANVTYYGYNSFLNRTSSVSPRWKELNFASFTTYYVYDQLNRRTKTLDPQQNVTYFDYDSRGSLLDTVDAVQTVSANVYNGLQLKITETVTDAASKLLAVTYHGYDIYKNKIRKQDGRGNTSYYFYDQINRLTASQDALLNTTYFGYNSVGNRTALLDARGNSTYYFYDLLTRNTAVKDAQANLTYFFYDVSNNKTAQVDALGFPTYYFYDELDRQNVNRDALGNLTYYFFDAVGNRTSEVDARFDPTYHFYDALNRQVVIRDALGNKTYFGYDARGNRLRTKDARNNTTYFTFDTLDRMNRTVDALRNTTYFGYDPVSNRTRVMDARFNTTYFFFDGLKRQTAMKDALGDLTYYFYDLVSNKTAQIDPRGNTTYYFYDPINRNSAIRDALGNATYFGYDQVSNSVRTMDARFNTTYFTFDSLNRRTSTLDPVGNAMLSGYDGVGNLTKMARGVVAGAGGVSTYYAYDGIRRRTAMLDAALGSTYYFYDATSDQIALKNPLQHTAYFGYDALNRLVQSQDPTGVTTYFQYDTVGNQTKIVDADNHATQSRFDVLNRLDSVRYADAGSSYFFYDAVSNRTKDVDPLGKAVYFKYDQINRLTAIRDGLGRNSYFEYDSASNRTKYLDAELSSAVFTYDQINRLTNITYATAGAVVADGLRSDPYFVYDPVSNLTQMGDLWGLHRMGYDQDNRMSQHQFPSGNVVYFRYDPRSNVTARVYPGTAGTSGAAYDTLDRQTQIQAPSGATAYFTYDAASNLTQKLLGNNAKLVALYDLAERVSQWRYASSGGASLTYFDYTRDSKGLITQAVREATNTVYYTYDANDRITKEVWAKTGATPSEVYGYRYAYDLAGNRTKLRANGVNTYYFYDKANQLTVKGTTSKFATPTYYKYDQNGSMTDLIEPSGTTKFAYNAAGLVGRMRWKDASFTYFFYDGQLRRYALNQNGTLNYFLWDGLDLLQEIKSDGTVQEEYTQARIGIPGIGQLVETNRPGVVPQKIYPLTDPRGTITKYLQSDGTTVVASREYESFGNLIPNSAVGTWPGIFSYQGQAWTEIQSADGVQRLLLSPTRLYDPVDGHFVSKDVSMMGSLGVVPQLVVPAYLYGKQNPVSLVDVLGRDIQYGLGMNVVIPGVPWGQPNVVTVGIGMGAGAPAAGGGGILGGGIGGGMFGGGGAGSLQLTPLSDGRVLQTWTCGDGRVYNYIDPGGYPIGNPCSGGGGGGSNNIVCGPKCDSSHDCDSSVSGQQVWGDFIWVPGPCPRPPQDCRRPNWHPMGDQFEHSQDDEVRRLSNEYCEGVTKVKGCYCAPPTIDFFYSCEEVKKKGETYCRVTPIWDVGLGSCNKPS